MYLEAASRISTLAGVEKPLSKSDGEVQTAALVVGMKRRRSPDESHTQSLNDHVQEVEPLTLEEEQRLLRAYEFRILDLCADLGFGNCVSATAATFFRRFYISRSPREFPPVDALHTAIFLGIKAEACPYTEVPKFAHHLARSREYYLLEIADPAAVTHETSSLQ